MSYWKSIACKEIGVGLSIFFLSVTLLTSSSAMFGFHSSRGHLTPIIPWETFNKMATTFYCKFITSFKNLNKNPTFQTFVARTWPILPNTTMIVMIVMTVLIHVFFC